MRQSSAVILQHANEKMGEKPQIIDTLKQQYFLRNTKQRKKRGDESLAKQIRHRHLLKKEFLEKQQQLNEKYQKHINLDTISLKSDDTQKKREIEEIMEMRQKLYEQKLEIGANYLQTQLPKDRAKDMKDGLIQVCGYKSATRVKQLAKDYNEEMKRRRSSIMRTIDKKDHEYLSYISSLREEKTHRNSLVASILQNDHPTRVQKNLAKLCVKYKLKLDKELAMKNYSESISRLKECSNNTSAFMLYKTGQMFNLPNGINLNKDLKKQKEQEDKEKLLDGIKENLYRAMLEKKLGRDFNKKRLNWKDRIKTIQSQTSVDDKDKTFNSRRYSSLGHSEKEILQLNNNKIRFLNNRNRTIDFSNQDLKYPHRHSSVKGSAYNLIDKEDIRKCYDDSTSYSKPNSTRKFNKTTFSLLQSQANIQKTNSHRSPSRIKNGEIEYRERSQRHQRQVSIERINQLAMPTEFPKGLDKVILMFNSKTFFPSKHTLSKRSRVISETMYSSYKDGHYQQN